MVDLQCGGEQPAGAKEGHRDAGHDHGEARHGQHDGNRRLPGGIPEVDGRELGLEFGKRREVVDELGDTIGFRRAGTGHTSRSATVHGRLINHPRTTPMQSATPRAFTGSLAT